MSRPPAVAHVRRMTSGDLDRVIEIAGSLKEAPNWPRSTYQAVLAPETAPRRIALVAEGPGSGPTHGHYVNMTDTRYRGVSCGLSATANGELWVVQDFYP